MAEFIAIFNKHTRGGFDPEHIEAPAGGKTLERCKECSVVKIEASTETLAKVSINQIYPGQISQPLQLVEVANVKEP